MDIFTMLSALESMSGENSPENRTQRELTKLTNIASVDHIEALSIGLAQCCAYARFIHSQSRYKDDGEAFVAKLGELLALMAANCGVHVSSVVEPRQ